MTTRLELYDLVPTLYRVRDAEAGFPLRSLLAVVQESLAALEDDTAQLYDDLFVETCRDEVLGLFADMLGVVLADAPSSAASDPLAAAAFADSRRREVADAIGRRRAKGTMTVLDDVASDVTGWPVRVQEMRRRVAVTQSLRHPEPGRGRLVALRDGDALDRLGSPFDEHAAFADVRRIGSHRSAGGPNPTSIAVVLWRGLGAGADRGETFCTDDDTHFTFDPLGRDVALAVRPQRRRPGTAPAGDLDVPTPITRQALRHRIEDYYGPGSSLAVYLGSALVARDRILVADLSDHRTRVAFGQVAVDPELGRIAFTSRPGPDQAVTVRYRQLQPAPIGGGSYLRTVLAPVGTVYRVAARGHGVHSTVAAAIRSWRADRGHGLAATATIEIADDATYTEYLKIRLQAGEHLTLRAAPGRRPVLRPLDEVEDRPERLWIEGATGEEPTATHLLPDVTLDGLLVAGHAVSLRGSLGTVTVRHCTLVPGAGRGERGGLATSLEIRAVPCALQIESAIVGRIVVSTAEVATDPVRLSVSDSVLDAVGEAAAVEGADRRPAYVALRMQRVTVLGSLAIDRVDVVEDCLVTGELYARHTQAGEVRFTTIGAGSRTPRRTGCQPDGVIDQLPPGLPPQVRQARTAAEIERVAPVFDAVRLGAPGYARLADRCAVEVRRGADDEGEVGAHHELWFDRRVSELALRLAEFTPAGLDCGTRFAT